MTREQFILLSFDVEEFDTPLEYRHFISPEEQLKVGLDGLLTIKEFLIRHQIRTTLFTTANFALNYPELIKELSLSHEIASHTFYHSTFQTKDLKDSKIALEKITGNPITGIRIPRMKYLKPDDLTDAGYKYDSSINPIWLPGRYNQLNKPKTSFAENEIYRIPASVSTFFRVPLFWLSFKNLPYSLYLRLAIHALKDAGYVCLYFHPWEFTDLSNYKLPWYIKKPDHEQLLKRLDRLIRDLKNEGHFITMTSFYKRSIMKNNYTDQFHEK
jgi:peptidoglycan/xylan/chitin deacetylase (PgdA/CDA1 family)